MSTPHLALAAVLLVLAWLAWQWQYDVYRWDPANRRNAQVALIAGLLAGALVSLLLGLPR